MLLDYWRHETAFRYPEPWRNGGEAAPRKLPHSSNLQHLVGLRYQLMYSIFYAAHLLSMLPLYTPSRMRCNLTWMAPFGSTKRTSCSSLASAFHTRASLIAMSSTKKQSKASKSADSINARLQLVMKSGKCLGEKLRCLQCFRGVFSLEADWTERPGVVSVSSVVIQVQLGLQNDAEDPEARKVEAGAVSWQHVLGTAGGSPVCRAELLMHVVQPCSHRLCWPAACVERPGCPPCRSSGSPTTARPCARARLNTMPP